MELKPCSFCGNTSPTLAEIHSNWSETLGWFVGYENQYYYFDDGLSEIFSSKEEAIEAWNKRS